MGETTRRVPVDRLHVQQATTLDRYAATSPHDFPAAATPGAGKTTFVLALATELIARDIVDKFTIMCPTEHLKGQWASSIARFGIHIDPDSTNSQGVAGSHFDGVTITYAQIGSNPAVHTTRTHAYCILAILDETHHADDSLLRGDGVCEALTGAARCLALTGTPFHSDTSPIPFVTYEKDEEGVRHSRADYTYGYGGVLKDSVARPVLFVSYSGQMAWRTSADDEVSVRLGEPLTKDMMRQAWRTTLDPKGEWIPIVLHAASIHLEGACRAALDVGGLATASNREYARAYAHHLRLITGKAPTVVLSGDADTSDYISELADSTDKWMVAVRMTSGDVDVPHPAVGVYATNASTPLFFVQAIGRYARACRRDEMATIFIPSVVPPLMLVGGMEVEHDHTLDRPKCDETSEDDMWSPEDVLVTAANYEEKAPPDPFSQFEVLGADAEFDGVLFDGVAQDVGAEVGSEEEQEHPGIPGLPGTDQVTTLLRARRADQVAAQKKTRAAQRIHEENADILAHKLRTAKRKGLRHLVSMWSRRPGETYTTIHPRLRSCYDSPEVTQTTTEQTEARITLLHE